MRQKPLLNAKMMGTTALLLLLSFSALRAQEQMPVTTSSDEARQLFIEGREQHELFRYEKSAGLMRKALEKDPSFALAHLYLTRIIGWNQDAGRKHLKKAIELADQVSEGEKHTILYFKAVDEQDEKAQEEHLRALLDLHPKDERIRHVAGTHYYTRGKYEKAIPWFKKAIELNDSYPPAFNMLGYSYMNLNKGEKADHYFKKYVNLLPDNASSNDSYAEFLLNQGRFDESIQYYRKALELKPDFVYSHIGLGDNYLFKGQYEQAKKHYRKAFRNAPNTRFQFRSLELLAAVELHRKNTREALKTMDEYLALAGEKDLPDYRVWGTADKALILAESGKTGKGKKHSQKVFHIIERADLNEHEQENLETMGQLWNFYTLAANGDLKMAVSARERCKTRLTEQGTSYHWKFYHGICGYLDIKQGNYEEAVEKISKSWDNSLNWYYKGLAYEKAGKQKKADKWYRKVVNHYDNSILLGTVRNKALAKLEE